MQTYDRLDYLYMCVCRYNIICLYKFDWIYAQAQTKTKYKREEKYSQGPRARAIKSKIYLFNMHIYSYTHTYARSFIIINYNNYASKHTHVYKVNEHSRHLMKKINANFIIINRKKFSIFLVFI